MSLCNCFHLVSWGSNRQRLSCSDPHQSRASRAAILGVRLGVQPAHNMDPQIWSSSSKTGSLTLESCWQKSICQMYPSLLPTQKTSHTLRISGTLSLTQRFFREMQQSLFLKESLMPQHFRMLSSQQLTSSTNPRESCMTWQFYPITTSFMLTWPIMLVSQSTTVPCTKQHITTFHFLVAAVEKQTYVTCISQHRGGA